MNNICHSIQYRYDPQINRWTKVPSMNTRRLGVGVAVVNGFLYAVGGSDGTTPLNTGSNKYSIIMLVKYCYYNLNIG